MNIHQIYRQLESWASSHFHKEQNAAPQSSIPRPPSEPPHSAKIPSNSQPIIGVPQASKRLNAKNHWEQELEAIYARHPGLVRSWIKEIFSERSHHLTLDRYEEFKGSTLEDLLQEPGNEELRTALIDLMDRKPRTRPDPAPLKKKEELELKECLTCTVLKQIRRNPQVLEIRDGYIHKQVFFKGIGHRLRSRIDDLSSGEALDLSETAPDHFFEEGKAFPSAGDNEKSVDQHHHLANLGILYKEKDGKREVLTLRSGRPVGPTVDATLSRLYETCIFACLAQWSCGVEGRKGFSKGGEPIDGVEQLCFQQDVITHLDTSKLKAMTRWIGAPDEWEILRMLMDALDQWPKEGLFVLLDDPDRPDKKVRVKIEKPFLSQQTASIAVRVPKPLKRYDNLGTLLGRSNRMNWADDQRRFLRLLDQCESLLSDQQKESPEWQKQKDAFRALRTKLSSHRGVHISAQNGLTGMRLRQLLSLETFWSSQELKDYEAQQQKILKQLYIMLGPEHREVIRWSWAVLYNQTLMPPGKKEYSKIHAYDRLACRAKLNDFLNVSGIVGCKSGKDRTALLPAYLSADDQYQDTQGHAYPCLTRPGKIDKNSLHNHFARLNKQALITFGIPVSTQSAGYNGIKWARKSYERNPVPLRGLPAEDIIGSSYKDRYQGKLRHERSYLGKSDPKFACGFKGKLKQLIDKTSLAHSQMLKNLGVSTIGTNSYRHCAEWSEEEVENLEQILQECDETIKLDGQSWWGSPTEQLRFTVGHLLKQRQRYDELKDNPNFSLGYFQ